jgi:hypothetical protein
MRMSSVTTGGRHEKYFLDMLYFFTSVDYGH